MQFSISKTGRLATLCGFLSSVALGCVLSLNDSGKKSTECPDPNSSLNAAGDECTCNGPAYDWCKPNDPADLTCCESNTSSSVSDTNSTTSTGGTTTDGTTTDGSATGTGGTTSDVPTTTDAPTTTDSGTTGEPLDCSATAQVPGSCNPDTENFLCVQADNAAECGPEGSKYYVCEGGAWVEDANGPNESCVVDGYDFAYGCEDADPLELVCGNGPGTDCSGSAQACNGDTNLEFCQYGKLGAVDCLIECMEIGDGGGVTYDFGYCGEQRGASQCICCDEGDEGCPLGGETTGGGSTGGGSSSGG
jgi:hypothetical protein